MDVPFLDLTIQHDAIKAEFDRSLQRIVATTSFVQGTEIAQFERAFADFIGTSHAIGVGNGTDALHLALRAVGIGPGDEVITAVNTFVATTEAIGAVGATPVLVDIDPKTYTLDPDQVDRVVSPRTRAIIPVHLYGQPARMDQIMEIAERRGVLVVEDACQAHGARFQGRRVGGIGHVGCFSFYPGKNLGAYGDAGMVVSNDSWIAERVRLLANHGSKTKYEHQVEGWNSRLDTIQAAVLYAKLRHLDQWNDERRRTAEKYTTGLAGSPVHTPRVVNGDHVWHLYVIETEVRDQLGDFLQKQGIGVGIHYPLPLHLQPAYQHRRYGFGDFPVAEVAASRILSLPMYPGISDAQIEYVVESVIDSMVAGAAA